MRRAFIGILLLLGVAFVVGCHDKDKHGEQQKVALHLPTGTPKAPQGMTALTVKPGPEPFTKQDVITYFQTHNLPKNAGSVSQFQVDNLEFITSKQASDRLQGVMTGLADTDRVGFVTLRGTFIFTGPRLGKSATFSRAYALFDATTGNLLMIGTLERTDQPPR